MAPSTAALLSLTVLLLHISTYALLMKHSVALRPDAAAALHYRIHMLHTRSACREFSAVSSGSAA